MKKILFLFCVTVLFFGCKKDFDGVINPENTTYKIEEIPSINSFTYTPADSILPISILFSNKGSVTDIKEVYANIFSSDGNQLNNTGINLKVSSTNAYSFSGEFPLSESYPNGKYKIEYYVVDKYNSTNKCAIQDFVFNNGKANLPPTISDLNIIPDSLTVSDTSTIKITLKAVDPNGVNDIEEVYFNVTKPDGTSSSSVTDLFDDGSAEHGDVTANDSIYSRIIAVYSTNMKGTYIFKFAARDRGKKISNIISHNVIIK
ncbi:MAG: hypothetical protein Q8903_01740 [Bacteroidota bacterium]|nr:hypothetical protein [Bacteroidota bacterium]